jgi:PAS domain S-box-containing protein
MQFVNRGLFDSDGTLREIQSVGRDITRLKEAERALRESEERLELAMAGSGMVAWYWDVPNDVLLFDDRVVGILGYTPREPCTREAMLGLLDPHDRAGVERALQAALSGDAEAMDIETRLRHKDGHWVRVVTRGKVLRRDAQAAPLRMPGTLLDVTQRRRLHDEGVDMLKRVESLIREATAGQPGREEAGGEALASLTRRERQILGLIAEGLTSARIGEQLHLTTNTVDSHRQNLMAKLGLRSAAEATRFAVLHGLIRQ